MNREHTSPTYLLKRRVDLARTSAGGANSALTPAQPVTLATVPFLTAILFSMFRFGLAL